MKTQVYPTDVVFKIWNEFVCEVLLTDSRLNREDVLRKQEEIEAAGQLNALREKHRDAVNDLLDKVFCYDEEFADELFRCTDPMLLTLLADRMNAATDVLMKMKLELSSVELPDLTEWFLLLMKQEFPKA
ncbi:MAG: hypothetical protein M0Z38_13120 [Deltaproteobacteria bacterium]|nr:hypothetical protein [Deltaproteobacteria bacterium]